MDLDETVLDNAGFSAMMLRSGCQRQSPVGDLEEKYPQEVGLILAPRTSLRRPSG